MKPTMPTEPERDAIRTLCETTLRQNWREGTRDSDGVPFGYTRPSPRHYPWQWYWDSCFTAVSWRHFDADRSRRELGSLLAAQRSDGFIGHTIFWNTPLRDLRRFTYNVTEGGAASTSTIQPPVLAWAWRIAVGDPRAEPRLAAHYDWLAAHRDLEGDGLLWIIQPDESGLDASPQFDPIWGRRAHGRPGFPLLVRRNRRLGFDLRRVVNDGGPACCEVVTNVLYGLSLLALGRRSITPQLVERCYDERSGLFSPAAWPRPRRAHTAHVERARRRSPCPTCPRRSAAGWWRSTCSTRSGSGCRCRRPRWRPTIPASRPGRNAGACGTTGAVRAGSTRPGCSWLGLLRLGYAERAPTLVERVAARCATPACASTTTRTRAAEWEPGASRGRRLLVDMLDPDPRASRGDTSRPS